MVIVEWGSRPTPGVYAQAMLHAGRAVELLALGQQGLRVRRSTATWAPRTRPSAPSTATKLSQIQQDDTPIMVPFFITQLRTQKKTVYGIQGPGNFYCIMSEAFKTA